MNKRKNNLLAILSLLPIATASLAGISFSNSSYQSLEKSISNNSYSSSYEDTKIRPSISKSGISAYNENVAGIGDYSANEIYSALQNINASTKSKEIYNKLLQFLYDNRENIYEWWPDESKGTPDQFFNLSSKDYTDDLGQPTSDSLLAISFSVKGIRKNGSVINDRWLKPSELGDDGKLIIRGLRNFSTKSTRLKAVDSVIDVYEYDRELASCFVGNIDEITLMNFFSNNLALFQNLHSNANNPQTFKNSLLDIRTFGDRPLKEGKISSEGVIVGEIYLSRWISESGVEVTNNTSSGTNANKVGAWRIPFTLKGFARKSLLTNLPESQYKKETSVPTSIARYTPKEMQEVLRTKGESDPQFNEIKKIIFSRLENKENLTFQDIELPSINSQSIQFDNKNGTITVLEFGLKRFNDVNGFLTNYKRPDKIQCDFTFSNFEHPVPTKAKDLQDIKSIGINYTNVNSISNSELITIVKENYSYFIKGIPENFKEKGKIEVLENSITRDPKTCSITFKFTLNLYYIQGKDDLILKDASKKDNPDPLGYFTATIYGFDKEELPLWVWIAIGGGVVFLIALIVLIIVLSKNAKKKKMKKQMVAPRRPGPWLPPPSRPGIPGPQGSRLAGPAPRPGVPGAAMKPGLKPTVPPPQKITINRPPQSFAPKKK